MKSFAEKRNFGSPELGKDGKSYRTDLSKKEKPNNMKLLYLHGFDDTRLPNEFIGTL